MTEMVNAVTQIINGVGFPIAAAIAMFWLLYRQQDRHKEESSGWMEAINNNTAAITALTNHLSKGEEDDVPGN